VAEIFTADVILHTLPSVMVWQLAV